MSDPKSNPIPHPDTIVGQGPGKPMTRPGRFVYQDDEMEGLSVIRADGTEIPLSEFEGDDEDDATED